MGVSPISGLQEGDPLIEELSRPPYNTGGGYSLITDSLGEYQVGATHEYWIGDQNGNGRIEWVVYYFYRPNSINGIDDDGDGCIDELTYSVSQTGCDLVPDAMVYFETGSMIYPGGSNGDVALVVDHFGEYPSLKLFKFGGSLEWAAYELRGVFLNPNFVGDFISYYSMETLNGVNANPEMDKDYSDYFVGNIDVRGFPTRPPVDRACSAGVQAPAYASFQRDDGWIVTSYELWESFDDRDWNGDEDKVDTVVAYYAIDPMTGDCRIGVNGGVHGWYPKNAGTVLMPSYTWESHDSRDWNGDGDAFDAVLLWHDIDSTWHRKGRIYKSSTYHPFFIAQQRFGFGFWGMVRSYYYRYGQDFPLKFGGAFYMYMGYPYYYKTFFWLVADEDGDRQTPLPRHSVGYGQIGGVYGGCCIHVYVREYYLAYADIDIGGTMADCNRDGDLSDTCNGIFCPDEVSGDGVWLNKVTTKYWLEVPPWPLAGYVTHRNVDYVVEDSEGRVALPFIHRDIFFRRIGWVDDPYVPPPFKEDLDGDLKATYNWIHLSWLFKIPN